MISSVGSRPISARLLRCRALKYLAVFLRLGALHPHRPRPRSSVGDHALCSNPLSVPGLFDPVALGDVLVPNRIVKSAMAEGRSDERGLPTPALARLYERWARGGVGLCITGMAHVQRGYAFTDHEIGLFDDGAVEPLVEVTRAVHRHGGRIFAQLCHAPPQLPRAKARRLGAVAVSPGLSRTNMLRHRAIRDDELCALARDFGSASRRAREAGFDGVQLHAAHGYLLSRLVSPLHNRRTDRWGGSFYRRVAFLEEVCEEIHRAAGRDFPVAVKLNAHDGVPEGLTVGEAVHVARRLEAVGVVAVEVSAGTADVGLGCYPNRGEIPVDLGKEFLAQELPFLRPALPFVGPYLRAVGRSVALREEAYFLPLARRFAESLSIPVICVGGIRSLETARRIVEETPVAMVSLARPLVRQPHLPRLWREGRSPEATCCSCNRCFVQLGLGRPLRCWQQGE